MVSPAANGPKRLYVPRQVLEISPIAELRRKGCSLQKIRRVLRQLQKELGKRLRKKVNSNSEMHLLTDGKSVYLEKGPDGIIRNSFLDCGVQRFIAERNENWRISRVYGLSSQNTSIIFVQPRYLQHNRFTAVRQCSG